MLIANDGNVGIGIAAPLDLLHLAAGGKMRIAKSGDASRYTQYEYAGVNTNANDGYSIKLGGTTKVKLINDRLGIGNTAPAKALHVGDAANVTGNGTIRLQGYSAGGSGNYHDIVSYGDNLTFYRNSTMCLFLQYNGNVGIGTTAPSRLLDVKSTTDDTAWIRASYSSTICEIGAHSWAAYLQSGSGDDIRIAPAGGTKLILKVDGKIGMGTLTPAGKLSIITTSDTSGTPTAYDDKYFIVGAGGTTGGNVFISYDQTNNRGYIGALSPSVAWRNLILQPGGGNVGIGSASPAAPLDVPRASDYKVIKLGDDITSHYVLTGNADHTLTLTCGSYFQAEIVITAHQTNGGTYNNLYMRGIWSNNDTSHHWDEIENVGSLTNSTFTITNGQNGATTNSGEWKIVHDYVSGTFVKFTVRITDFYGTHAYTIS